ncbi:MAG: transporter [Gammaproteobacteria bacterium]
MFRWINIPCLLLLFVLEPVAHAQPIPDPCGGRAALLALLDRPTVGDSACAVPEGHVVVEAGGQYLGLRGGGTGYNLPELELRLGLPGRNELVLLPPNGNRQSAPGVPAASGFGPTVVGIKHEFSYTAHWLGAVEGLLTAPSGSRNFGSGGTGAAINGIVAYSPTPSTSVSLMLGATSQTLGTASGGGRYTSINPDFVATWAPTGRLQLYAETYGQTQTGPGAGSGWDADGGVQYLLTDTFEVDLEGGARLSGNLGGFDRYVGAGFGLEFP